MNNPCLIGTIDLLDVTCFVVWSLCLYGIAYYFGYDKKCREIKAKEAVDSMATNRPHQ